MRFSFLSLGVMIMLTVPTRASNLRDDDDGYRADREPVQSSVDPVILSGLERVSYHIDNPQGHSPRNAQATIEREFLRMTCIPMSENADRIAAGKLDSGETFFWTLFSTREEDHSPKMHNGGPRVTIKCLPPRLTSSNETDSLSID